MFDAPRLIEVGCSLENSGVMRTIIGSLLSSKIALAMPCCLEWWPLRLLKHSWANWMLLWAILLGNVYVVLAKKLMMMAIFEVAATCKCCLCLAFNLRVYSFKCGGSNGGKKSVPIRTSISNYSWCSLEIQTLKKSH